MRHDKLAQRLKSRRDSFDFNALIAGVSTLVEEKKEEQTRPEPEAAAPEESVAESAVVLEATPVALPEASVEVVEVVAIEMAEPQPTIALSEPLEAVEVLERLDIVAVPEPLAEEPQKEVEEGPITPSPLHPFTPPSPPPLSLTAALDALACRLTQEAGKMGVAMQTGDAEEAGFYLAHVNQILELLRTLDPRGDLSRQSATTNAPPPGRRWPETAWTVVEFADSPWSALLPSDADEVFVRQMLYAAWGLVFDTEDS